MSSWAHNKTWWIYLPLALLYGYCAYRLLDFPDWTIPFTDTANLGIHEIGHEIFRPLGNFMHAAGGTLTETMVPLGFAIVLFRRGWLFAGLGMVLWLVTALKGAAIYAADAVVKNLVLINIQGEVSTGDGAVGHDWEYLLGKMGLLDNAQGVGSIINGLANAISVGVVLASFWLVLTLFRTRGNSRGDIQRAGAGPVYGELDYKQDKRAEVLYRSDPAATQDRGPGSNDT